MSQLRVNCCHSVCQSWTTSSPPSIKQNSYHQSSCNYCLGHVTYVSPVYIVLDRFCLLKFSYGYTISIYLSVQIFVLLGERTSCELVRTNICAAPCQREAYPNKYLSHVRIEICMDENKPSVETQGQIE